MSETSDRAGQCLCGHLRFTARGAKPNISACHCGQCRRWSGGPYLSVSCKSVDWAGEGRPVVFKSSDWAERGGCGKCATPLFWRMTTGKYAGVMTVALGSLDDQDGFTLEREWFIDKKPGAYALAGERECVTEAQAMAMFAG